MIRAASLIGALLVSLAMWWLIWRVGQIVRGILI
jgi:hypothetical protein